MRLVLESRFVYFCLLCLYLRQVWSISARDKNISQFSSLFNTEHWQVQLWKNAHDSFWRRNIFLVLDAQGSQIYAAEASITQINSLFFVIIAYKLLLTEGLIKFWVIVLLGKCLPSADFGEDSSGKEDTYKCVSSIDCLCIYIWPVMSIGLILYLYIFRFAVIFSYCC